jgi:hypothetical protein
MTQRLTYCKDSWRLDCASAPLGQEWGSKSGQGRAIATDINQKAHITIRPI